MPIVLPLGFAQVIVPFHHRDLAREAIITFGVEFDGNSESPTAQCDTIFGVFMDTIGAVVTNEVTIGPVRMSLGTTTEEHLAVSGTQSGAGGVETKVEPGNIALLVHKITDRGGKRGRGRFYLPWVVDESGVSEIGMIASASVNDFNVICRDFLVQMGDSAQGMPLCLIHGTSGPGSDFPTRITGLVCDPMIGVQRKRLGR